MHDLFTGTLALLVQDMALNEYQELEKFSSISSSLSHDQYNLPSSETNSQSGDGGAEPPTTQTDNPEVILRKPSTKLHEDFCKQIV